MDDRHMDLLKEIVQTPSPTGFEERVADVVRGVLGCVADEVSTDTMGSVHATYQGYLHHGAGATFDERALDGADALAEDDAKGNDELEDGLLCESEGMEARIAECEDDIRLASRTLMFAAHMDEIGLMVTYISPEGFLSVSAIGGVDAAILPGMRVDVHAKGGMLRGVVGRKPIHLIQPDDRKSVTALDKLVIDLGMPAERVKEQVSVGDPITFAVGFERFGDGMAVSRAFDDKAGVFVGCRVMQELAADPSYTGTFVAALTVQEEIGTRGAMTSAHSVKPDVAIAFDVTHATDYPGIDKTQHGEIVCGEGPVIARGPNINPVVFERLVEAAEAEGIKYQIEAEPSVTGTDARAIQVTRGGIPTGLVSIPLRYMHTPTEVIDLDDLDGAIRLISRFARDLDDAFDFVPGHPEDTFSDERLLDGGSERIEELMDEVERLRCALADLQAVSEFSSFGDFEGADCAGCAAVDFSDALDAFDGRGRDDAAMRDVDAVRDDALIEDDAAPVASDANVGHSPAASASVAPAIKIRLEADPSEALADDAAASPAAKQDEDAFGDSVDQDGGLYCDDDYDEPHLEPARSSRRAYSDEFAAIEVVDAFAADDDPDEGDDVSDTVVYDGFSTGAADMPTMSIPIVTVASSGDERR